MILIRRRYVFIFVVIFLAIYLVINYAIPSEDLANKIHIEHDKTDHSKAHIAKGHLKQTVRDSNKATWKDANDAPKLNSTLNKNKIWDKSKEISNSIDTDTDGTCSFDLQQIPQSDVQMLDMYTKMSFEDRDGGAWKQGWNVKYDPLQYNEHHKLKVFVVPHSHNDPGWIKTFDDYYDHETKHILSNALRHLRENPDMKFIWAEISYFSRFFTDLGDNNKEDIKKLVKNGQLEFVTGGWVMPDEANSHWRSVLMQLTEGQTWLKQYFNMTPTSSWSIDPFGHSPTMPYILKKSGFKNLLIQRTHYSVKKELALRKQLEFYWRQLWDDKGSTDLFTHMMPFYSYDIPHSCGPDPKICCQFDFKRLAGFGLSCPWRVPPQQIEEHNVAERAELLVDQWKKKSQLYKTNVLLFPLGDDFRYSQSTEWEVQRVNYEALFQHINNEAKYFVQAQFGTLQEYFDAVHQVQREQSRHFPTLSGDFFTYADRTDNYWSGYYTSRPYHKRMDRVLLHYIHSAEMLHAWSVWPASTNFDKMLTNARQQLSLFQHHDGITGTAKTHVVEDYAKRMLEAVKDCKFIMQQAVYRLLTKHTIYNADYKFHYFLLDDSRWPGAGDSRTTIILGKELPLKHLAFHNTLPQWREEVVDFYVASPYIRVVDFNNNPVLGQVSPVWSWHKHSFSKTITPQASTTKYRLIFKVRVPPLGLSTYIIKLSSPDKPSRYLTFASNLIMASTPITTQLGDYPEEVKFTEYKEISLKSGSSGPTVAFTSAGMMKSIQLRDSESHTPVKVQFVKYGTRFHGDRSGAYLFLPNGPATSIENNVSPVILVTEGPLESAVSVGLSFGVHHTILRDGEFPEIRNYIDISDMDDVEIAMRFKTRLHNGDAFYTDLNGLQMIRRQKFSKLPLQANYYPIPSAIYIEDESMRLTVVTAQPLGGSSLASGEVEIMQDRRLTRDDERGLGQGVLDNQPILHIFRVVLERMNNCEKMAENHPAGALTANAYKASNTLLNPLDKFIFSENEWIGVLPEFGGNHVALADDVQLAVMRNLEPTLVRQAVARNRKISTVQNTGLIIHRTSLLQCGGVRTLYNAEFTLHNLLQWPSKNVTSVQKTTLTFLQNLDEPISIHDSISLCPMDTLALIIRRSS